MLDRYGEARPAFSAWLLQQRDREGWIGQLVEAAQKDPQFPRSGGPDDVRKRLNEVQADGDLHQAVDDAELDWLSY